jgi:hypothetical protein
MMKCAYCGDDNLSFVSQYTIDAEYCIYDTEYQCFNCGARTEFPDSGNPTIVRPPTNSKIIDSIEAKIALAEAEAKTIPLFEK